jgi:D-alanyl-D-alanine carboxypeptidase/D-alanyl-D-alanine-endopeptidase (penicillin-binding protein 4)
MADAVVAKGVKVVRGDVVGDDTHFAWEPYGADWAVDDLPWGYGAPVSALAVNDDQLILTVAPGTDATQRAVVTVAPDVPYYTIRNEAWSLNPYKNPIGLDRAPGSKEVRVFGGIAVGAAPHREEMAILDPAEYVAMAFRRLLEERGVTVQGTARALHWEPGDVSGFLDASRRPVPSGVRSACPVAAETVLATHVSPPLAEDVVWTNKVSQNLHAEMLLRDMGAEISGACVGSLRTGEQALRQFLLQAGVDKDDFVFFDGSGLSGHDLVTPRATAQLLAYAARQPWFAAWRASLPVGGVDGSLSGRFAKAPLRGRVFAKTGTLGEARALSGYVVGASGRTVIFSVMVGNHAPGTNADRDVMDRIVAAIAANN